jgi:ribosomal protein S18
MIGFSESELKIFYKIKAPRTNAYSIKSSYKDLSISGGFNKMDIQHYSGDLVAQNIETLRLDAKYGTAEFREIQSAVMEIYEQEIEASFIGSLELNAKYSDIAVQEIEELEAKSYETDFVLNRIGILSGDYKYGEIEVKEEITNAIVTLYENDIEAKRLVKIKLEDSKYSKLEVDFGELVDAERSYEDEFNYKVLGSLKAPETKYGKYTIGELTGSLHLFGYEDDISIRSVSASASKIMIDGKYLNVDMGVSMIPYKLSADLKYGGIDYDKSQVAIKKYIKENDKIQIEGSANNPTENSLLISIKGYEVDVDLD